jgi:beta-phosphoglucomutase
MMADPQPAARLNGTMAMLKHFDAILFDFDGVLIDSEPVHYACWREVMEKLGVALDWETYDSKIRGHSAARLVNMLCALADPPLAHEQVSAYYQFKNDRFRDHVLADPGTLMSVAVKELLDELRGRKLAVVSSARQGHVYAILDALGLRDRFETLVCREDVETLKPSPEPYLTAARRMGVTNPLVVEDSDAGAESGRAAGFEVLMIPDYDSMPGLLRKHLKKLET